MNPNPLYRTAVAELEDVLSPRVVSRSLKEGMAQTGSTPEAIGVEDLERILKGQIYRHLQVAMPVERAKGTISEILERLRSLDTEAPHNPTPAPLDAQYAALEELKSAMRPFNLYFEWPEVQKLRAQIQLLDSEQSAGREAGNLLREAREQLRGVSQKLEDQLVIQARDLGELEGLLEQVSRLEGPKVRRLDHLLGQIREAQSERQLATAEVERGRKIAAELRKVMESSAAAPKVERSEESDGVLEVESPQEERVVVAGVNEGVDARLLRIDLESDGFELDSVESANANLLDHRPELRAETAALRERLAAGVPLGDRSVALREELDRALSELRGTLAEELAAISHDAHRLTRHLDTGDLNNALQVATRVLENSLPAYHDMQRIRDLHSLLQARAAAAEEAGAADAAIRPDAEQLTQERLHEGATQLPARPREPAEAPQHEQQDARMEADRRRQEELEEIRALELESARFAGLKLEGFDELYSLLEEARLALAQGEPGKPLSRAWLQLEALRSTVEQRLSGVETRLDAALATLAQVEKLNSDDVAESRRILHHLDDQRESLGRVSLGLRLELESSLQRAESLLAKLQQEFEATRVIADQLVSGNFIDDMLGLLGSQEARGDSGGETELPLKETSPRSIEARSDDPRLNAWIEGYLAEAGVTAAALLDDEGRLVSGKLLADPLETRRALEGLMTRLGELGAELGRGAPQVVTLELGELAVVTSRPIGGYRFLAVLEAPLALSRVLHRLRDELAPNAGRTPSGSQLA